MGPGGCQMSSWMTSEGKLRGGDASHACDHQQREEGAGNSLEDPGDPVQAWL